MVWYIKIDIAWYIVKNGKAASVLKSTSIRRKTKEEQKIAKMEQEEEKKNLKVANEIKSSSIGKRFKMEEIPGLLEGQNQLIQSLRAKGIIDERGNMIS